MTIEFWQLSTLFTRPHGIYITCILSRFECILFRNYNAVGEHKRVYTIWEHIWFEFELHLCWMHTTFAAINEYVCVFAFAYCMHACMCTAFIWVWDYVEHGNCDSDVALKMLRYNFHILIFTRDNRALNVECERERNVPHSSQFTPYGLMYTQHTHTQLVAETNMLYTTSTTYM